MGSASARVRVAQSIVNLHFCRCYTHTYLSNSNISIDTSNHIVGSIKYAIGITSHIELFLSVFTIHVVFVPNCLHCSRDFFNNRSGRLEVLG